MVLGYFLFDILKQGIEKSIGGKIIFPLINDKCKDNTNHKFRILNICFVNLPLVRSFFPGL